MEVPFPYTHLLFTLIFIYTFIYPWIMVWTEADNQGWTTGWLLPPMVGMAYYGILEVREVAKAWGVANTPPLVTTSPRPHPPTSAANPNTNPNPNPNSNPNPNPTQLAAKLQQPFGYDATDIRLDTFSEQIHEHTMMVGGTLGCSVNYNTQHLHKEPKDRQSILHSVGESVRHTSSSLVRSASSVGTGISKSVKGRTKEDSQDLI